MSEKQDSFVDGLLTAARENPLAAAMIGGGALWLLMGSDNLKGLASSVRAAAGPGVDLGMRGQHAAFEAGADAVQDRTSQANDETSSLKETLRDARNAASDAISGATDSVGKRFDESVAATRDTFGQVLPGKETLNRAQSSLADILDRQPLVLGVVGLAIGATVAGALAKSSLEDGWVGEMSDSLKADLTARAGAVSQSVREASDTLKAEFAEAGEDYLDRMKSAGRHALDAAGEKLK